jgi:hypothetical protein
LAIADWPIERPKAESQLAINIRQSAMELVAVAGIEPTSLDYQSSALAVELHRERRDLWALSFVLCTLISFDRRAVLERRKAKYKEQSTKAVGFVLVDPTGLKPAPHGLKGRCSVTRAPGQEYFRFSIADCRLGSSVRRINRREMSIGNRKSTIGNNLAVAEGFEPSHGRINNPVPYQLGYVTKEFGIWNFELRTSNLVTAIRNSVLEAMKGVEPLSTGLQDRRSDIQLSYIAEREFVPGPSCPTGAQGRRLNGI